MQLKFKVTGQVIVRTDTCQIVSGSKYVYTAAFSLPEDYEGFTRIKAFFARAEEELSMELTLNETTGKYESNVDDGLNLITGDYMLYLVGYFDDGNAKRLPAVMLDKIKVVSSGEAERDPLGVVDPTYIERMDTLTVLVEQLQQQIEGSGSEAVQALSDAVDGLTEQANTIDQAVASNTQAITANANNIVAMGQTVSGHTVTLSEQAQAIQQNSNNISDLSDTVAGQTQAISENTNSIGVVSNGLSALGQTVSEHTDAIAEQTQDIADVAAVAQANTEDIGANTADIGTLQQAVSGHDTTLTAHAQAIAANTQAASDNASGVAANTQNIAANAQQIAVNKQDIADNRGDIDRLQSNSPIIESYGNVICNFADYSSYYSVANATLTKTTDKTKRAAQSVKIKPTVAGSRVQAAIYGLNISYKAGDVVGFFWNATEKDIDSCGGVTIQASNGDVIAAFSSYTNLAGWNFKKWIASADVTTTSLTITIEGTSDFALYLDSFVTGYRLKPKVMLCFDDSSTATIYDDFFRVLKQYGFPATFALQSGVYPESTSTAITKAELVELQENGWDWSFYYGTDANLGDTTVNDDTYYDAWEASISGYLDILNKHDLYNPVAYFCRHNLASDNICEIAKSLNVKIVRMANSLTNITHYDEESIELPTWSVSDYTGQTTYSVATVKGFIDKAVNEGSCISILCHGLMDVPTSTSYCSEASYTELLDYIKNYVDAGQIEVVTYSDFYKGFYKSEHENLLSARSNKINNSLKDEWNVLSPSVTWGGATPTGVVVEFRYKIIGKTCFVAFDIYCADGNGSTSCSIALPEEIRPRVFATDVYPILFIGTKRIGSATTATNPFLYSTYIGFFNTLTAGSVAAQKAYMVYEIN